MRIVAGRWRGRRIRPPDDTRVRPTADRVREAWMSIIQHDIPGSRVVDLFAGSGALGLETLSRGAIAADFVESDPKTIRVLKENIQVLGAGDAAVVHRGDAVRFAQNLEQGAYDLAVADPPYSGGFARKLADLWLARPFARILSIEHDAGETLPGGSDTRKYGTSAITFYRREE